MIRDYHTAEDITQDVFIDGYIKLNALTDYDKIGAWLAKIAKNKCYNYLTREAIRYKQERELDDFIPDMRNQTPESYIIHKHEQDNLERAVKNLPEQLKTVTVLFYFENYSQKKIADVLNIPEGTVKRRLYDARLKLKKELDNMSEKINNINFEEEIAKKIKSLRNYWHLHNFSNDGIQKEVEEFIKFIDDMPESKLKHKAYSIAYNYSDKEDHKKKVEKEVEISGEDAESYIRSLWGKVSNSGDEEWLKSIDGEDGLAKVEKMENSDNAVGEVLFWRGAMNTRLNNLGEARKDYTKAKEKLRPNDHHYFNTTYANVIAALKGIETLETTPDKYMTGNFNVTGECYRLYDNGKKLDFVYQPGFGMDNIFYPKNSFDSIYYYSSGMGNNRKFFDMNMQEGETIGEDTLVSKNETVTIIAGTFENCVHIKSVPASGYWSEENLISETWYAKDIGLIKCYIKANNREEEIYELYEYKINGGNGYLMPATVGNLWKYKNINLPDFYEQIIEFETISVFNEPETKSTYIYVSAFQMLRVLLENCDSDIYLALADKALPSEDGFKPEPKKWDFDTAIKNLKFAVQRNSSVKASLFAVNALAYVKKYKAYREKLWHLLPGSIAGSSIVKDKTNDKIIYKENDYKWMGPYTSWGPCFDETKCMGIKPFRILQRLAGTLFDEKWVAGYTEQRKFEEGYTDLSIKVEDGGTITTKAGIFENCLKVTFDLEHISEKAAYKHYYLSYNKYPHCGTKIYYFAPNVGVVKYDSIWGESQTAVCELTEYNSVATSGEYMPIYIGNKWIYDEMTLEPEYIARRKCDIVSGMENEFFMIDEQEMLFKGNDEEYEEFKKKTGKLHYSDKEFYREETPKN